MLHLSRTTFSAYSLLLTSGLVQFAGAFPVSGRDMAHHVARGSNTTAVGEQFEDARFTWFTPGSKEVACGGVYGDDDLIVALNDDQWEDGAHCGESVTISFGGHTASALIVDHCPPCEHGALDLTKGLFSEFEEDLDVGVLKGSWFFDGSTEAGGPVTEDPEDDSEKDKGCKKGKDSKKGERSEDEDECEDGKEED